MAMRTFMKSSALAAAAALALAAILSGCSTFGVAPFPEPIRPPIEAEGEDTIRERDGVLTFLATQEIESGEVPLLMTELMLK